MLQRTQRTEINCHHLYNDFLFAKRNWRFGGTKPRFIRISSVLSTAVITLVFCELDIQILFRFEQKFFCCLFRGHPTHGRWYVLCQGTAGPAPIFEFTVRLFHQKKDVVLGMLDVQQVAQGGPQGGGEFCAAICSPTPETKHSCSLML